MTLLQIQTFLAVYVFGVYTVFKNYLQDIFVFVVFQTNLLSVFCIKEAIISIDNKNPFR